MKHVDVAIVGGSLAGAACVRELHRSGIDAVAFERDRFPREKVCGGFLSPGAIDLLDELELLGTIRAAGAKTVRSSRVRMCNFEACVALPRSGLGISRRTLDRLLGDHPGVQHGAVRDVQRREENSFRLRVDEGVISARVVVDAAGKLSRFTSRRTTPQFGVQFYESGSHEDILDFWFFEDGYGGAVSVEGNRSNACFLIYKEALPRYLRAGNEEGMTSPAAARPSPPVRRGILHPERPTAAGGFIPLLTGGDGRAAAGEVIPSNLLVTGPLSYERLPSEFLSIGDAAGMVDPFCGEGMRHALDTGMCAAKIVAEGLRRGESYDAIRASYDQEARRRWSTKRRIGRFFRTMLQHPRLAAAGFGLSPEYWLRKLWN